MKLEHFAINVESPLEMAQWYAENFEMKIVRKLDNDPFTTFLSDESGRVMIEIYNNPAAEVPDYKAMDPLILHLAFVSENPEDDKDKLISAGATYESEIRQKDGSHLIMLRDPWGIPIQLCKRMIKLLDADIGIGY